MTGLPLLNFSLIDFWRKKSLQLAQGQCAPTQIFNNTTKRANFAILTWASISFYSLSTSSLFIPKTPEHQPNSEQVRPTAHPTATSGVFRARKSVEKAKAKVDGLVAGDKCMWGLWKKAQSDGRYVGGIINVTLFFHSLFNSSFIFPWGLDNAHCQLMIGAGVDLWCGAGL